ncbi:MAG TPA: hypothetical protein VH210_16340 [Gaiellaceae bacterium]|nr:hypothetical protein [Gaiellaceae bacterium]
MESRGQEHRSQVELPGYVEGTVDVFVNGVPQVRGVDYEQIGRMLVFRGELAQEGKLGFWRWISLFFGVAGTYRKNDTVDVVFTLNGHRTVESLQAGPVRPEEA